MSAKTDFPSWLLNELEKRDWIQSDLAHKADISRQAVSDYINRKRVYYEKETLVAIARAFEIPEEEVFIAAGVFSAKPESDKIMERIEYHYNALRDPANKQRALDYLELLRRQEEKEKEKTKPKK